MKLAILSETAAKCLSVAWNAHHSTKDWTAHKLLDELYHWLIEAVDRIAECCRQHNEPSQTGAAAPVTPDVQFVIESLGYLLLDLQAVTGAYDIGVDNMAGDLFEKAAWWQQFALPQIKGDIDAVNGHPADAGSGQS